MSPRPALAAAGSRRQRRKDPGARRGRRFRLAARARPLTLTARRGDGSARRHRPGATAQRPVWARSLGGLGGAGAAAGHSWHALNSFFIKHQTTKVRMFAELELPYDLIS